MISPMLSHDRLLKLRYTFNFNLNKKINVCILYSIMECLEYFSNVDVVVILFFFSLYKNSLCEILDCIFV